MPVSRGDLPADGAHAAEQRAALLLVDDRDERVADFDAERIDGDDRVRRRPARGAGALGGGRRLRRLATVGVRRAAEHARRRTGTRTSAGPGISARPTSTPAATASGRDRASNCVGDFLAEVRLGRRARRDQAAGHRHEQRRNRRDEALADRQDRVGLGGRREVEAVLDDADDEPGDDVDAGDEHGGERVALREADRAVHRAVEVGLAAHPFAPLRALPGR